MNGLIRNQRSGFTLIEFIVALVVAAVIAAMVYNFFGSSLTQSSVPIYRLQKTSNLHQVMENIVADFNRLNYLNLRYKWRSGTAYPLNYIVLPTDSADNISSKIVSNGFYYKCTSAGTSGTTRPTWEPASLGATVSDSSVTWTAMQEGGVEVWQPNHVYTVGTIVIPTLSNGHYYKCTAVIGTAKSALNEPSSANTPSNPWPTATVGAEVTDGEITWKEVGTILDRSSTSLTDSILLDSIKYHLDNNPGRYGTGYTVVAADTKFIQFNGTTEVNAGDAGTSSEKSLLKVTIKNNDSAEALSGIFTIH